MRLQRSHAHRIALGVAAASLAAAACGGGSDPVAPALSGEWELVAVESGPLPHLIMSTPTSTTQITSGRLSFRSRGRVLDVQTYFRQTPFNGAAIGPDTSVAAYEFDGNERVIVKRSEGGRVFSDTGLVDLETGGMLITVRDVGPALDVHLEFIYRRLTP